jgi:hypothetical protein
LGRTSRERALAVIPGKMRQGSHFPAFKGAKGILEAYHNPSYFKKKKIERERET